MSKPSSTCMFCDNPEVTTMPNGKKRYYQTDNPFICGTCTQKFINMSKEQKKEAYDRAISLKKVDLVKFLENHV